jgi:hypothetical protein
MIITLTTDIGWVYAAEMKGTMLSINPGATVVDISHAVSPQNVVEGAFVLRSVAHHFPKNTVHVGVVDPGVGTGRRGIIVVCDDGTLVGPDNGLLMPAAERLGLKRVYEISNKKFITDNISNTFHGRDIFAPVAAYLSKGTKPSDIGKEVGKYTHLKKGDISVKSDRLSGQIMYIDQFGNIITNIPGALLKGIDWNEEVTVRLGGRTIGLKFLQSYGYAAEGELLLTVSSFDLLEIACNKENAGQKLSAMVGQNISIIL